MITHPVYMHHIVCAPLDEAAAQLDHSSRDVYWDVEWTVNSEVSDSVLSALAKEVYL